MPNRPLARLKLNTRARGPLLQVAAGSGPGNRKGLPGGGVRYRPDADAASGAPTALAPAGCSNPGCCRGHRPIKVWTGLDSEPVAAAVMTPEERAASARDVAAAAPLMISTSESGFAAASFIAHGAIGSVDKT